MYSRMDCIYQGLVQLIQLILQAFTDVLSLVKNITIPAGSAILPSMLLTLDTSLQILRTLAYTESSATDVLSDYLYFCRHTELPFWSC